ncbi:S-adenosyl-L-methionine-dependent methyltransferase [Favolaschia claudopus]|uniref:S-adenosyl-L-methionine-dependent methyltransferase n=1 Tax=Favolaschia claudopus TaxID=2862362 RepID=A0AAW0CDL9_9AGAR
MNSVEGPNDSLSVSVWTTTALIVCVASYRLWPQLKFVYHCFLRPTEAEGGDPKTRLDQFYEGQADIYDATRGRLLRGRNTMVALSASHLKVLRQRAPNKRFVWVDIGGGTGRNIEMMDKHFPIENFDAIYLVDLCEPLLEVARRRIAQRGWKNVTVLCQDACTFWLPEWPAGTDPRGSVDFVTMSYSITMINRFYTVLDRVDYILNPTTGLIGIADFYTAGPQDSLIDKTIGGIGKECGWMFKWAWHIFFEFDHLYLGSTQRTYLEHRFGTIKSYNGRNHFIIPYLIQIPYFTWLGRARFPEDYPLDRSLEIEYASRTFKTPGLQPQGVPLTPFHYSITTRWRLPYFDEPEHVTLSDKSNWVVGFDDYRELMRNLEISLRSNDSVLLFSNASDTALHLAINFRPKQIHCVDPNPCRNHLLELKLAAAQTLEYEDFFVLFGEGKHPAFRSLLDSKLAPYLSSAAYQFWRRHETAFSSSFYYYSSGCSKWALSLIQLMLAIPGVSRHVAALCDSESVTEQALIWRTKLRSIVFNRIVALLLESPFFCRKVLGLSHERWKSLLQDGGVFQHARDTLDAVFSTYLLKTDMHFWHLILTGRYSAECCPEYLTRSDFEHFKADNGKITDAFQLHTKSVLETLRKLPTSSLKYIFLMDHVDSESEVEDLVSELDRVLLRGGSVYWQSFMRDPSYNKAFKLAGFEVNALFVRDTSRKPMDRVNLYASSYQATK